MDYGVSVEVSELRSKDYEDKFTNQCCICGRPMKNETKFIRIMECKNGTFFTTSEMEESESGFLGWFECGSGCYKKFLKKAKEIKLEPYTDEN